MKKHRQQPTKGIPAGGTEIELTPRLPVTPFAEGLKKSQQEAGARRKGERTRDRLKVAAVVVLDENGYLGLRIADVCKRAKVSPAVFYLYFKNKQDITVQVLTEFVENMFKRSSAVGTARTLFDSLCWANLHWIASVRANAGLMRCLLQLSDQVPAFRKLNEQLNHEWFVHVTKRLLRRFPGMKLDEKALLLAVYALGGMMDEISRKVLVSREEHLQPLVDSITPTDESLAEFLSVLWHRALFGSEPASVRYRGSKKLLTLGRIDPIGSGDTRPSQPRKQPRR